MIWYHPKYYAEMRKLARELRQKSSSVNQQDLLQAASLKHQASEAPSGKPQAPSTKLQASSRKRQAP